MHMHGRPGLVCWRDMLPLLLLLRPVLVVSFTVLAYPGQGPWQQGRGKIVLAFRFSQRTKQLLLFPFRDRKPSGRLCLPALNFLSVFVNIYRANFPRKRGNKLPDRTPCFAVFTPHKKIFREPGNLEGDFGK